MDVDIQPQTLIGWIGAGLSALCAGVWSVFTGRVVKAEKSFTEGLDRVEKRAMVEITRVETEADRSFKELWGELGQHRDASAAFRTKIAADVGALPTRVEMERMFDRIGKGQSHG